MSLESLKVLESTVFLEAATGAALRKDANLELKYGDKTKAKRKKAVALYKKAAEAFRKEGNEEAAAECEYDAREQERILGDVKEDMGAVGEDDPETEESRWFGEQYGMIEGDAVDTRSRDIAYDVWTTILNKLKSAGVPDAQAKQEAMKMSILIKEPIKKVLTTYAGRS